MNIQDERNFALELGYMQGARPEIEQHLLSMADEIERLTAERDSALADAKRYQWLRSRIPGGTYRIMGVIYSEGGDAVDAAIDAAMKGEQS